MTDREFFEGIARAIQLLTDGVVLVHQAREYIEPSGQRVCPKCKGVSGEHAADCPLATWLDAASRFLVSAHAATWVDDVRKFLVSVSSGGEGGAVKDLIGSMAQVLNALGDAFVLVRRAKEHIETAGQPVCPACEGLSGQHATDCSRAKWLDDARTFRDGVRAVALLLSP